MGKIVDFVFALLKTLLKLAVIGLIGTFILLILAVLMPNNAAAVLDLIKNIKS